MLWSLTNKTHHTLSHATDHSILENPLRHTVWFLGVSCSGLGVGFNDPCGPLPTQHIFGFSPLLSLICFESIPKVEVYLAFYPGPDCGMDVSQCVIDMWYGHTGYNVEWIYKTLNKYYKTGGVLELRGEDLKYYPPGFIPCKIMWFSKQGTCKIESTAACYSWGAPTYLLLESRKVDKIWWEENIPSRQNTFVIYNFILNFISFPKVKRFENKVHWVLLHNGDSQC